MSLEVGASDHLSILGRRLVLPAGMTVSEAQPGSGDVTLANGGSITLLGAGAVGDGTTDDAAAINAAIATANTLGAASGVVVEIDGGGHQYVCGSTIVLRSYVRVKNAELILKAGANTDLVKTLNFDSLTGGGTSGGVQRCGFEHVVLDGNKANNASGGAGLKYYGALPWMEDVIVRNCHGDGIYSEWSSSAVLTDGVEGHWRAVATHDNDGNGVTWAGPHDSIWEECISFLNGGKGFHVKAGAAIHVAVGCHSWGTTQTYAWYIEAETHLLGCQGEGATTAQLMLGANDCEVLGGKYFGGVTEVNTKVGIQLGDGSHLAPTGLWVKTKTHNCDSGAIDFTNCGANAYVEVLNDQTSGTVIVGSIPATATTILRSVGVALAAGIGAQFPSDATFKGGANALQVVGSNSKFNVNASSGATDLPNSALLRGYQGNFAQQTWQLNGGTGAISPGTYNGTTGAVGAAIYSGSGVPTKPGNVNPVAGDIYFRTDTPSTASQRIYVCTTGGASPVWAGIV